MCAPALASLGAFSPRRTRVQGSLLVVALDAHPERHTLRHELTKGGRATSCGAKGDAARAPLCACALFRSHTSTYTPVLRPCISSKGLSRSVLSKSDRRGAMWARRTEPLAPDRLEAAHSRFPPAAPLACSMQPLSRAALCSNAPPYWHAPRPASSFSQQQSASKLLSTAARASCALAQLQTRRLCSSFACETSSSRTREGSERT